MGGAVNPGTVTLTVKRFPADLHHALKVQSAEDDEEMRQIVQAAVERELARRATLNGGTDG
jgi:plasmid stability protein